jgi:pyrroloquinoline quinone biosynthesis protein B
VTHEIYEGCARSGRDWKLTAANVVLPLLLTVACRAPGSETGEPPASPYALVLGTAQDGGLPQIGCDEALCARARREPDFARMRSSLLLVDPAGGARFLVDAGPDLAHQVELARGEPAGRALPGPRPALFEGILLTHAHWGHYAGLAELGRESYGARGVPVLASARMAGFLRSNGPWSLLVDTGAIELRELVPGEEVELSPWLAVTPLAVPHRDEFSDTLAFLVRGPRRTLLYLPDIDKWERWERPIEELLRAVDVALLDGSFFADGEIPGRSMAEIPHPFVEESLARFSALDARTRAKVFFTHLNHTNPLCDPASEASAAVRAAGMGVAREGVRIEL